MASRRAKFASAAEEWLRAHAANHPVTTQEFWDGLCRERPDLTTPSERRKTPRATCMRDVRKDAAFEVGNGHIALRKTTP